MNTPDRTREFEEVQHRSGLLDRIMQKILTMPPGNEAAEFALEQCRIVFQADLAFAVGLDMDRLTTYPIAEVHAGGAEPVIMPDHPLPIDLNAEWFRAMKSHLPILFNDVQESAKRGVFGLWDQKVIKHGFTSLYACSFFTGGEISGSIGILYERGHRHEITPDELSFLNAVCRIMEVLFSRRRYVRDIIRRDEERSRIITSLKNANEKLLTANANVEIVNKCLSAILHEPEFGAAVRTILEIIGIQSSADRVFVFRFQTHETASNTYEWCAKNVPSAIQTLQNLNIDESLPGWSKQLHDRLCIRIDSAENIPEDLEGSCATLEFYGVHAILVQGIWKGDTLIGFLGMAFTSQPHCFLEQEVRMVESCAGIYNLLEQRQTQSERLSKQLHLRQELFDKLPFPILIASPERKLLAINDAGRKFFPCIREKAADGSAEELDLRTIARQEPGLFSSPFQEAIRTKKRAVRIWKTETERILWFAVPLFNANNELIYVIEYGIVSNETAEGTVPQVMPDDVAGRGSDLLNEQLFTAEISHELRTPLLSVIGCCELIRATDNAQEQTEYLDIIYSSGKNLLSLIDDFLDLSKIRLGQLSLVPSECDIRRIITSVQSSFTPSLVSKKVELTAEFQKHLPIFLLDGKRLRQILANIVGNAVQFTDKGSISIQCTWMPETLSSAALKITVSDTGCGIPKNMLEQIFSPFRQVDAERDANLKHGAGLGLTLARDLAAAMGGGITVESELNEGSSFTIFFPHAPVVRRGKSPIIQKHAAPPRGEYDFSRVHVMLVDDAASSRKYLASFFLRLGVAELIPASCGDDVLSLLDRHNPDIIVTDLYMPGMDGIELADRIHARKAFRRTPVIILTADADMQKHNISSANDLMFKPVTIPRIRQMLRDYCPNAVSIKPAR